MNPLITELKADLELLDGIASMFEERAMIDPVKLLAAINARKAAIQKALEGTA